jgi:hypothetical protein
MPKKKILTEADGATPLADSCECGCNGSCKGHGDAVADVPRETIADDETKDEAEANNEEVNRELRGNADEEEVLAPMPSQLRVYPVSEIKLHQGLPIHDHSDDSKDEEEELTETYDVDDKLYQVWVPLTDPGDPMSEGGPYLIDGHHHLQKAKAATHFVTSKQQKGRLVSTTPDVMTRCYYERDGWTLPLIQKLSYLMNFDGKKAVSAELEPFGPGHPIADGVADEALVSAARAAHIEATNGADLVAIIDEFDRAYEVITDGLPDGVLMRLKQLITRANVVTAHGVRYTTKALNDAVDRANVRARTGIMLGEKHHPTLVPQTCDRHGCGPRFYDNPNHKTCRWTKFTKVQTDGAVYGFRDVLDTPDGRTIKARADAGQPIPLSARWMTDGDYAVRDGAKEPQWLDLITVDDVEMPAMVGAGRVVPLTDSGESSASGNSESRARELALADSSEAERQQSADYADKMTDPRQESDVGLVLPGYGLNQNTTNPHHWSKPIPEVENLANHPAGHAPVLDSNPAILDSFRNHTSAPAQEHKMPLTELEIRKTVRAFNTAARTGASKAEVKKLDYAAMKAIADAYEEGLPIREFVSTYKSAFADEQEPGYHPSESGPYVELGSLIGPDADSGWAPDLRARMQPGEKRNVQQKTSVAGSDLGSKMMADAEDEKDAKEEEDKAKEKEEKDAKKKVEAKMDEFIAGGHSFVNLPNAVQKRATAHILRTITDVNEVEQAMTDALTAVSATQAKAIADQRGLYGEPGLARGHTTDRAMPLAGVTNENRPGRAQLEKLIAATDDTHRNAVPGGAHYIDPDSRHTKQIRKHNRAKMDPILDEFEDQLAQNVGKDKFFMAISDGVDVNQSIESQFKQIALTDSYAASIATFPNQPTVLRWMLTESFQDQRMLQFCMAQGPGQGSDGGPGWELQRGIGRVFKVSYETYQDPPGWGQEYGSMDMGLLWPENGGIGEGTINIEWDTFFPLWRLNATSTTIQAIKSIGNGPLNLASMARQLWHMSARKSRTIDTALANEMANITMEYGAVAVSGETYTSGNNGLTNQTVYQNGSGSNVPGVTATSVVVNLNPADVASAAITFTNGLPTSDYIAYPTPGVTPGPGGQVPIAAVRLLAGQAVTTNSAPYFGANGKTKSPIVPPRSQLTLTSAGADSVSTLNPITMTAPTLNVQGLLGPDGYIYSYPGTTATYAVDWPNGVVVFASGVSNNSGIIGTTVTLSYSYATNFDYFPVVPGINGLASLATGETPAAFANRLLTQIDVTAGIMSSWPRFVVPDLALMSTEVSPIITSATAFFKLNSPEETTLYPSEDFFATRDRVDLARINTPWWVGNNFIIESRRNTTRYIIDTPWENRGPYVKYDSAMNVIAGEGYYGAEASCICTPQVKNSSGTIINPVARGIMLVQGGQPI